MDNIKVIKRFPIFKNLEENEISPLLRCFAARILNIKEDETFIHKGERISFLYIIISGIATDISYDNENATTYIEYKPGDIIGLQSFAAGRKTFERSVNSKTEIKALLVDAFRFLNPCQNYCPRHTRVLINAISSLSNQTISIADRVQNLTNKTTKEKSYLI